MMKLKIAITCMLISGISFGQTNWRLDQTHSNITFTVGHMVVAEVEGSFTDFEGTVTSTSDDFDGAEVSFTAKTASISTDNERRDNHLRSDDFFNAEAYPEVKFEGTLQKEGSNYFLVGDLTMRDVTREERFEVKYNGQIDGRRGKIAGFKVMGTIDRFDYGVEYSSTMDAGGLVVSEEVAIECKVELREVTEE